MGKKGQAAFEVDCPHCQARLTVDPGVEAILEHVPPPEKSNFDLDEQLSGMSEAESKRDALFQEQVAAQKKRSDLLDAKFRDSLEKRKDEPAEKPLRDFDLD
jgi:hypothetical protein